MIFINTDLSYFKILELTKRIKFQWIRGFNRHNFMLHGIGPLF